MSPTRAKKIEKIIRIIKDSVIYLNALAKDSSI